MKHRAINTLIAVITCCLFISLSGILGPWLDEPRHSDDLNDAMRAAKSEMRRNLAAAQLCNDEFGPGAKYAYTPDGVLVCKSKNSKQVASK